MTLSQYQQKRNFTKTPEPGRTTAKRTESLIFVIQRHKASHLHYDFRLEMDGVLKSWAIPKGPSLNPADKRLAMQVEDHPYDYKDFKGIIPEGNYGAGIVEIWDKGTYTDIDNSPAKDAQKNLMKALKAGSLKLNLQGKKLKGEFALVKLKSDTATDNAWLLIKHKDNYAVADTYDSEADTPINSPINQWLRKNPHTKKKTVKNFTPVLNKRVSSYIPAMLVKEADKPFDDKDWVFEIKWDGYRAIAELNKADVQLYSRNGNLFNQAYPELTEALAKLNLNAVIDGEIVVMDETGTPNFQLLQHYAEDRSYPIYYYVFDLLKLADESLMQLPLLERKERLKKLLKENDLIKYSDHIEEHGKEMFELLGKQHMEGIIAKKADSPYLPGKRTANWLKIKHHKTLDALIGGFTKPAGTRKHFGALVLGIKQGESLRYIGHTGSGFTDALLKEVAAQLQPLITTESPFTEPVVANAPVTWVQPVLVCEVKYSGKTRDGKLRHPIFLRMRDDKTSEDTTMDNTKTVTKNQAESEPKKTKASDNIVTDGRHKVPVSHWDKLFWPDEKIKKGDVVNYYLSISDVILPYLKNRPESLKRNPGGITDKGFFHKDAGENVPAFVQTFQVHSDSADKIIDYIICNNKATLAYLNNLGCIELNPWHSTIQALEYPDYVIIDIDPSDKNTFEQVIETANVVHDVLERAGAANYCKTSGATGLHIYIPTKRKYTYDQLKDFAELICALTNEQLPQTTSMERSLNKRGNKIYLDHLQNRYGQTIAAAYSLRPYPGATVSTPLEWQEVKPGLTPDQFNIYSLNDRLTKTGDLFKDILGKGIDMKACLKKLS